MSDLSVLQTWVWKSIVRGATTHSMCDCGRQVRRGRYPCLICIKEQLAELVGLPLAELYINSVKNIRLIEEEMELKD